MINRITLLFYLIFFSFGKCLAFEDDPPWILHHYTDGNGLPQNSVKSIARDQNGFIWMTTEDGLVRFDGNHFVRFGQKEMNISSSRFQSFYPGLQTADLFCFNDKYEYIRIKNGLPFRDTVKSDFSKNLLQWSAADKKSETGIWKSVDLPNAIDNMELNVDEMVFETGPGDFYRLNRETVTFYEKDRQAYSFPFRSESLRRFFILKGKLFYLNNGVVSSISDKGIHKFQLEGDILNTPAYRNDKQNIKIFWNISMRENILLYCNNSFYLARISGNGSLVTKLVFSDFELAGKNIIAAYFDTETGNLFLGSTTKGLFILSAKQFKTILSSSGQNTYYGQTAYNNFSVLTAQGYLLGLKESSRVIKTVNKLASADYYNIITDSDNRIWLKRGQNLFKLDKENFSLLGSWKFPENVSTIYEGDSDQIWIGIRKTGLAVLNRKDNAAQPRLVVPIKEDVTYLQQVSHDTLYMSTDKGLYRVSVSSKRIDTIDGLQNKYVRSIYAPHPDEIWISTYQDGFFLYYKGRLTSFPNDKDNYIAATHCIIEDNKGFLWLTTNKGLFQAAKADLLAYTQNQEYPLYYHYYNKSAGFNTNEFNGGCQPCAVRLNSGYISLPSLNGMVFFNPDSIRMNLPDRNDLFLDKIEMDNKILNETELIDLPRQFGRLNFYISSPYSGNIKNLQISYAISEKKGALTWQPLPSDGIIAFSTLPTGDYTLVIRKLNGFGKNNYTLKEIKLIIPPAWYQTKWFYISCVLLLATCMWLFVKMRFRYIKRRNKLLEQIVADKIKELQLQMDIQDKIIRSVSHDIQTPLQYQKLLSAKVYETLLLDEGNSKVAVSAKVLNDSTHRLYYMVENLLKYLRIQMVKNPVAGQRIDLYKLTDEKLMIFKDVAKEKGTLITNNIAQEQVLYGDVQLISVILHNLIDNAVKVTRNGRIDINAARVNDSLCLTVDDTGPGMPVAIQKWINDPHADAKRANTTDSVEGSGGIGLLMVKELSELLGLKLMVSAEQSKGTSFSVIWKSYEKKLGKQV